MNYEVAYSTLERAYQQKGFLISYKEKSGNHDNGLGCLMCDGKMKKIILRSTLAIEDKTRVLIELLWNMQLKPERFCHVITESGYAAKNLSACIEKAAADLVADIASTIAEMGKNTR